MSNASGVFGIRCLEAYSETCDLCRKLAFFQVAALTILMPFAFSSAATGIGARFFRAQERSRKFLEKALASEIPEPSQ
jgi:hypothetical protein